MLFEVGQKVVYPNHGVSVVEEISSATFDDVEQTLFHLRLLSNNSKVMVPKENLELVGLRPLCKTGEIQELIDTLQNGNIDTYKDWKGRYKQNLDKMKTGQLSEVAEVLKNLRLVSQKKSLSFREKKMYERAKYFIVSELAQVKKIEREEAETIVEESLESSLEKLRQSLEAKRLEMEEGEGKQPQTTASGEDDKSAGATTEAAAKTEAAEDAPKTDKTVKSAKTDKTVKAAKTEKTATAEKSKAKPRRTSTKVQSVEAKKAEKTKRAAKSVATKVA